MSDYYQDQAGAYAERTQGADPARFLGPLVRWLPAGARILDVGCGSGRDLAWLKSLGFRVAGFEKSRALVARARRKAGCTVVEGDFERFDFNTLPADAVILVGALVHVPPQRLGAVLARILGALGPWSLEGGSVYLSLKQGGGIGQDRDGRRFYLWQDSDLRAVFDTLGLGVLQFAVCPSALGSGESWLGYVLRPAGRSLPSRREGG